ncbi:SAV_2336 N-terminal domain-related protein, partial [Dactylosporangium darangshiense]|uniref:SAV_2336 N-terminal domain-related protein n=1 Tax=Dactylosporangium darangshiense TaxID=579108 RepID=UPI0031F0FEE5
AAADPAARTAAPQPASAVAASAFAPSPPAASIASADAIGAALEPVAVVHVATAAGPRAPSASSRALAVARAIAPLRRVRRPGRPAVDIDATVEATADAGRLTIVTRPRPEPGLDLALVVDDSPVMPVWRDEIARLEATLRRLGLFRLVERWPLDAAVNEPGRLADPDGRRVVLVLTDGVTDHWYRDTVWRAVDGWARAAPTTIVHLLPEPQWGYTAVGRPVVALRTDRPAAPNRAAALRTAWWSDDRADGGVAVPVVPLRPEALGRWARSVAGHGEWVEGVWARPPAAAPAPRANAGIPPADRVAAFQARASERAQRLAAVLAGAPVLTLPLIQLLQAQVLRDTDPAPAAEVLAAGLLERLPSNNGARVNFRGGVAEALRSGVTASGEWDTYAALTTYLDRHPSIGGGIEPFAAMRDRIGRRLGLARPGPARQSPLLAAPRLIVKIQENPSGLYLMRSWAAFESALMRLDDHLGDRESMEGAVAAAVDAAERAWSMLREVPTVEFVLPRSLIDLPVQWWRTRGEDLPLCVEYDVVVRSLDVVRDRALYARRLRERWRAAIEAGHHRLTWARAGEGENLRMLQARLRLSPPVTAVMLSGPPNTDPGRSEHFAAIAVGVPVVLWVENGLSAPDVRAGVERLMDGPPEEIVDRVTRLRREAVIRDDRDHLGRRLGIVVNDPELPYPDDEAQVAAGRRS